MLVKMHDEINENKQNKQMREEFGSFLQKHLAKCTKEIEKIEIVCEHF